MYLPVFEGYCLLRQSSLTINTPLPAELARPLANAGSAGVLAGLLEVRREIEHGGRDVPVLWRGSGLRASERSILHAGSVGETVDFRVDGGKAGGEAKRVGVLLAEVVGAEPQRLNTLARPLRPGGRERRTCWQGRPWFARVLIGLHRELRRAATTHSPSA